MPCLVLSVIEVARTCLNAVGVNLVKMGIITYAPKFNRTYKILPERFVHTDLSEY